MIDSLAKYKPVPTLLHGAFLFAHVFISLQLFEVTPNHIESPLKNLGAMYNALGFDWGDEVTFVVGGSFILSLIVNLVRRILEAAIFGWPQFREHDKESRKRVAALLLFYGTLTFIAVGALGSNTDLPLNSLDLIYIFTATYILGLIVNIIDIFVSSLVKQNTGKAS